MQRVEAMSPAMTLASESPPHSPRFIPDAFPIDQPPVAKSDAPIDSSDDNNNDGHDLAATMPSQQSAAEAALAMAQSQIVDLESQIQLLNEKATAAIYRCAAYEVELARVRTSSLQSPPETPVRARAPTTTMPMSPPGGGGGGSFQRFSSLLGSKRSRPNMRVNLPVGSVEELVLALDREQGLRAEAEERARRTGEEAEDLSVAVFERANEMVAAERRERARLEERVRVLEGRERGRGRRLDILEGCVERMGRAREFLDDEREKERERRVEREREQRKKREMERAGEAVRETNEEPAKVLGAERETDAGSESEGRHSEMARRNDVEMARDIMKEIAQDPEREQYSDNGYGLYAYDLGSGPEEGEAGRRRDTGAEREGDSGDPETVRDLAGVASTADYEATIEAEDHGFRMERTRDDGSRTGWQGLQNESSNSLRHQEPILP